MSQLPPYPGAPRWVKVAVALGAILAAILAIVFATGLGGPHGPGRHMGTGPIGAPAETGR